MSIKIYRPLNPGLRQTSVIKDPTLTKERPLKSLLVFRHQKSGRNSAGKITVRHRGGGARRYTRLVDFKRDKYNVPGRVSRLEYDPNRNTRLALIAYRDGERRYILANHNLQVGQTVMSSQKRIDIQDGNRMPLKYLPTGSVIFDIELRPGRGGKLCRSAGNAASLMAIENGQANLKLPSGEVRLVSQDCAATLGTPSNAEYRNIRWGKAGRIRHLGIRPTVRGKVMNPVDHPHGGGEGKNAIGLKHPKTYTGKPALGVKTRKSIKHSNKFIIQRRRK